MNTAQTPMYEWKDLPWRKIERDVFKLQKRIYQASRRGNVKAVHRLQRLLLKSWSAKCLAVRRVTQDNHGKRTAGIDGVKSLSPAQRLVLVGKLGDQQQPKPVRRVWIPKPGTSEKRPLGILMMPSYCTSYREFGDFREIVRVFSLSITFSEEKLESIARRAARPALANGLTQFLDNFWGQFDPARSAWFGPNTI